MSLVVVTRGGWGDVWEFDSRQDAELHPLIQSYDAIVDSSESVAENWNYLLLPRMISEVIGDQASATSAREEIDARSVGGPREDRVLVWAAWAWDRLRSRAAKPPTDPRKVVAMIVDDRVGYDLWHRTEASRRTTMADNATTTAAAPKTEKPKTIAGFAPGAKISFGKNKDGAAYDTKDNNPKRGASAERFRLYKADMTVEAAVAAGVTPADIKWDVSKGFIAVK